MTVTDFNRALLTNSAFLMPFAISLTQDKENAKDLFQETIFRALINKDKYSLGTNLKAWLYTIMRNIFINRYRRKSRQYNYIPEDFFVNSLKLTIANEAEASINTKQIQKEIFKLPDAFKYPFVLYFDGYKYTEIATILQEPLGTIKSRIYFARKLLKAQIERF